MKYFKPCLFLLLLTFISTSCFKDEDDNLIPVKSINDFVWKGMNKFYLYKDNIPDLANTRFDNNAEYEAYLNSFSSPENLFESLIYQRETIDRFSWIVDDYIALEQLFNGITTSNGMEFQLFRFNSTDINRYGVVTHVLPNTSAEENGIKRGDIFYGINGSQLTKDNLSELLNLNNYSVNLGIYNNNNTEDTNDDFITPSTTSVSLSKTRYTEDPVLINKTLNINGTQIGYLMYNGFTGTDQFNADLNTVFGKFKNDNTSELVIDLRYNPGGSVYTAIMLGSLITGQFTGDVFSTEQWNDEFQDAFQNEDPELLINRFFNSNDGTALNSLNLNKVYILTTSRSASASELIIAALRPYINVVQIGTTTSGKYQASTTLYDSDNFRRQGANPGHTYAMQPLIFKSLNVDGFTDYFDGLTPTITLKESVRNMGVLGDENEPLLAEAISHINGSTTKSSNTKDNFISTIEDNDKFHLKSEGMYIDKELPSELIKRILFE